MKTKTINTVLTKKMDEWCSSITDEALRKRVEDETIVTGGCIASMLLREPVSDYDVYLGSAETVEKLARYYVERFKAGGSEASAFPIAVERTDDRVRLVIKDYGGAAVLEDPSAIEDAYQDEEEHALEAEQDDDDPYRPVFLSTNAITLSGKIQLVIRFHGTPEKIHETYDYAHCTCYWTRRTGVVLNQPALESLLTKELRYRGSLYPLCSIIRIRKFVARGWTINAGQILKMAMQMNALDLEDVATLEDQLTGVDVAYFNQAIALLRERDAARVDGAYLLEIIERIF